MPRYDCTPYSTEFSASKDSTHLGKLIRLTKLDDLGSLAISIPR